MKIFTTTMKKINIRTARRLYEQKQPFTMVPCNLQPNFGVSVNRFSPAQLTDETFDVLVDAFRAYNCINNETGRQVAFYVEV